MPCFLLTGSCLLIRGVYTLDHQALGFEPDHLLTAGMGLDHARYADGTRQEQFVRELMTKLKQIPGVNNVAVASDLPASGLNSVTIHIKGQQEARANELPTAEDGVVTSDYFRVIGVSVLKGRAFNDGDDATSPRVVLVNQQFVRKYFPNEDPIGKQIQVDIPPAPGGWSEIVGVVSDVKSYSEDPRYEPQVFELYEQRPVAGFSVMLRSTVDPTSLTPALRHAVADLDVELPLLRVMSMDGVIDLQLERQSPFLSSC